MDLLDYVKRRFGKDEASNVKGVFARLHLPLPKEGEFRLASDTGAITFLNPFGAIVRIYSRDRDFFLDGNTDHIDHPLILQPLGIVDTDKLRIEICPGVQVMKEISDKNYDTIDWLDDTLKKDGLNYFDKDISNTGILPIKTAVFPEGIPVVIDRGAVRRYREHEIDDFEEEIPYYDAEQHEKVYQRNDVLTWAQKNLYGAIGLEFALAWENPDPHAIDDFWETCRRYTTPIMLSKDDEATLLHSDWQHDPELQVQAVKYERRIDREAPDVGRRE